MDSKYLLKPQQAYSLMVEEASPCYFKESSSISTFLSNNFYDLTNISTTIPNFSFVNLRFSYEIIEANKMDMYGIGKARFCKENLVNFYCTNDERPIIKISKYNIDYLKKHILNCITQNNDGRTRNNEEIIFNKIIFNKFTGCLLPSLEPVMELVSFGNREMRKYLEQKYDSYCKNIFDKDEFMTKLEEHLQKIMQERKKEREIIGQALFSSREEIII